MLHALGRFLQACGLIIAPMAILYYMDHQEKTQDFGLGTMEWVILACAVAIFSLGRVLERSSGGPG